MKSKILVAIFGAFILFSASSCEDYLDVNHDPNMLETIPDAKVLLPAAELSLANQLMGWDGGFGGGFWAQYWTQNYTASQFKTLCEYQEASFETAYIDFQAGVLSDLERMKSISKDNPDAAGTYYAAEALSIFTWQIVTDTWGDVPYTEALQASNGIFSPKFDKGEDIYKDLLTRVDNLLKMDISKMTLESKYDFFFQGSLKDWKKFVNSLKLKLMLRTSETPSYDNSKVLAFVQNNSFLDKSVRINGNVWDDTKEGKRHPMREFQEGSANYLTTNVIACKSFIDYLKDNSDPRLATLFKKSDAGDYKGAFFGDFESKFDSDGNKTTDDKEKYSSPLFTDKMDLMVMSAWEINFYIAEVYARANDNVNAKKYYEKGVLASLTQQGIASRSIINVDGYAKWVDGSAEDGIKQIAMQKWVANANYQHLESFLERNRTKYPSVNTIDIANDRKAAFQNFPVGQLTISVTGRAILNGNLPASPVYPASILTRNSNAPGQKENVGQKVWWNKKAGL